MYIRHIDHRSGAPWGPHGREGVKAEKNKKQSTSIEKQQKTRNMYKYR